MTWRERIVAARERGRFDPEDMTLASCWSTCAVGEQHTVHPEVVVYFGDDMVEGGVPQDDILATLGGGIATRGFALHVSENNFNAAEGALDKIEDRVLMLKRAHYTTQEATNAG